MKIIEKLTTKANDNWNAPSVTIAFLGDSVTQGCFELYLKEDGNIETVFDKNSSYPVYLGQLLSVLYPTVPVNLINGGVSGGNAAHGLSRLEQDVLCHRPDLTVVCFGLNDCHAGDEKIPRYVNALDGIFTRLQEEGSEIIFMTPNMMCTRLSCLLKNDKELEFAEKICTLQNNGTLTRYLNAAKELCQKKNIPVCDVYAKWQTMHAAGVDVTTLLSNYMNHPTREMNRLFAISLVETMMGGNDCGSDHEKAV